MIKCGDTIGIIALGGDCEKSSIEHSAKNLEMLGFNVKLSKNIYDKNRYLAGSDKEKIKELHNFFQDEEIKLILNARGGYGAIRLLDDINYEIIRANPKSFCGYSDITALLLMFYKKCGLNTYHGPMATSDFGFNPKDLDMEITKKFSINYLFKALNNEPLEFSGTKIYKTGDVQGIIWGGNLSTVVSLCGLDFIPEKDFIFFTEDLNEPVYKIDKMFTQLFNIAQFKKNCKGIVLGDFLNTDNQDWLEDLFKSFNIPTVSGFKITHKKDKITLPIGKEAILKNKTLKII